MDVGTVRKTFIIDPADGITTRDLTAELVKYSNAD
jgi:hypothetical protein